MNVTTVCNVQSITIQFLYLTVPTTAFAALNFSCFFFFNISFTHDFTCYLLHLDINNPIVDFVPNWFIIL